MGEDREKVVVEGPDDSLVGDVEGHALASDLPAEREAVVEDEDVEGHTVVDDLAE